MNSFDPLIKSVESYLWLIILIVILFVFEKPIIKLFRKIEGRKKRNNNYVEVFVENEKGSTIRTRYDEKTFFFKEKFEVGYAYPYNYGFIIGTHEKNGDAIDCYVLSKESIKVGKYRGKILGMIEMIENGEEDNKALISIDNGGYKIDEIVQTIESFIRTLFKQFPEAEIEFRKVLTQEEAVSYIQKRKR